MKKEVYFLGFACNGIKFLVVFLAWIFFIVTYIYLGLFRWTFNIL
ncbi:hypothetical protein [Flavobacterium sp.]|nr:hypothetical protein [Flavobacterium sp.]